MEHLLYYQVMINTAIMFWTKVKTALAVGTTLSAVVITTVVMVPLDTNVGKVTLPMNTLMILDSFQSTVHRTSLKIQVINENIPDKKSTFK